MRVRKSKSSQDKHKAISIDSGHLEGPWQGHFPVTCVAMMSLLDRAAAGEEKFSPAERVLFVACEFWSALNAVELEAYFDLKAEDPTRDARVALRIVGAVKLADMLDRGVLGPAGGRASVRRRRRVLELQADFRGITEPVDLLLARFAWRQMTAQRRAPNPQFSAPPEAIGINQATV
ncbi:MAG: hypothetical protein JWN58_2405 [Gammaproteobacteria bacterium]|jgi:hypothetical protein|nr:hypothetical protein [Gammaproteobacteria bacterium]